MGAILRRIGLIALSVSAAACGPASASLTPGLRSPTAGASLAVSFPIGTWTATLTEADLRAAGITNPTLIRSWAGFMTLTYAADGTWTHSTDTEVPVQWPVFRGDYVVTGPDTFEMRTTFPPDFVGELVRLRWVVENGALELDVTDPPPPEPIIHIQFETHPWQPQR